MAKITQSSIDRGRQASPAGRVIGIALGIVFVSGVLFGGMWIYLAKGTFTDVWHDRSDQWPSFYKSQVQGLFTVPAEAQVLEAEELKGFMVEGARVVFTLPSTKTPKEWMHVIVADSPLKKHRVNDYLYDGSRKIGDYYVLEYHPATQRYTAEWQLD
jgi:hypothetical protein